MNSEGRPVENKPTETQQKGGVHLKMNGKHQRDRLVGATSLVIVDSRVLDRQCLAYCLGDRGIGMEILAFGSIGEWRDQNDSHESVSTILLNIGSRKVTDAAIADEVAEVVREFSPVPVVVLADSDDLVEILKALECGAKGYIPSSICFEVCVEAVNLAVAGGIFIPATSIMDLRKAIDTSSDVMRPVIGMFTRRQEEVIQALRRGKANKVIAYELKMRESTVKVHIRNIMRKLKARNRTEAAYKLTEMFPIANRH